ncbi:hypothetical protein QNO21_09920 [Microbacterium sp. zg-Y818]|uniref:hypothetical protein n=1 Tax=unclassified Microbacterium TaxID=2609290 RepID=UPI00214AEBBE|nr:MULTISPECIES: hypothetical protein [unclassified Microbacterium]MCR2799441.1 hypothetical protein [Microbacterium sp. zg.Y818]WIM21438.1 hypothetical protein QNO21_09920 [Microbacterium sp. zg-Y818]
MHPSRASRVVRGALAAAVATFVALVSHVTAGGQMPGWVGIVVPLILSLAVCTVLVGRRLSLWRLSLGVALSQALFHTLFVLGTFSSSAAAGGTPGHHAHGAAASTPLADTLVSAQPPADATMWLMHGLAAVVTVAALYRGERALMRMRAVAGEFARWARRRLIPVVCLPAPAPSRRPAVSSAEPARPLRPRFASSVARRGPPLTLTF